MKNDNLTPYDRFIINKKSDKTEAPTELETKEPTCDDSKRVSPQYAKYLQSQLRRTEPSDEKVLTEEEFCSESRTKKTFVRSTNGGAKAVQFKKFGKIFLCAYVIIMLALALIVIVKTTVGDNTASADAASMQESDKASVIETMQDEESEESDNWFDKFCDSLK